jgi:predicted deacylase
LTGALVNGQGTPAVTLEVGPRRFLDRAAIDTALAGILGVLAERRMVGGPAPDHPTRRGGGPWRRESGPRANAAGLLVPCVRPGDDLRPETVVAEVRAIEGAVLETLRAGCHGFVVALTERATVTPGVACATIAVRER